MPPLRGLPPGDVQDDPAGPDVLEDGNGLGVGEALEGKTVHRKDLVTCRKKKEGKKSGRGSLMLIYNTVCTRKKGERQLKKSAKDTLVLAPHFSQRAKRKKDQKNINNKLSCLCVRGEDWLYSNFKQNLKSLKFC